MLKIFAPLVLGLLAISSVPAFEAPPAGEALYVVQMSEPPLVRHRVRKGVTPAIGRPERIDQSEPFNGAWLAHLNQRQSEIVSELSHAIGRPARIAFSYRYALAGFAVSLQPDEVSKLAAMRGVHRVERSKTRQLAGDAGPAWIGADEIWSGVATGGLEGTKGEGVVIGVIDTGIDYTHPAFAETEGQFVHQNPYGEGKYLGWCDPGNPNYDPSLECNEKLVGLWNYADGPADSNGHGTQIASIAAGISITARLRGPVTEISRQISGVAPHATIIAYDACSSGCPTVFLVAAIDQAVADGVDVLLYAVSGSPADPWDSADEVALLSALEAGVSVITAAGNGGPDPGSVNLPSVAPWVVATGMATHDRVFSASLITDGGTAPPGELLGRSLTTLDWGPQRVVHAASSGDAQCLSPFPAGTWDGEIVVCDRGQIARVQKGANVEAGGAGGFVLANTVAQGDSTNADLHVLPAIHVDAVAGDQLRAWLGTGSGHVGQLQGAVANTGPALGDLVPSNSARGPNVGVRNVLKPNLLAPSSESLAASIAPEYFEILSGTSASAASAAGAAALLRALHPSWGPTGLRSALETTAAYERLRLQSEREPAATPFDRGSGRVELRDAARVGLLLEETAERFENADPKLGGDPSALNLAGVVRDDCPGSCSWKRTVRGLQRLGWSVSVSASVGLNISVKPETFEILVGETQELIINAEVDPGIPRNSWLFAEILLGPDDREFPAQHLTVAVQVPGPIFVDGFEGED